MIDFNNPDFAEGLRCQKKRKKRYASGRDRRGQIMGRRPISERPEHIEARSQIGHWEGDTVIGAAHKQAIVTLVERKSGYALIAKVSNKTSDLVSQAIIPQLNPVTPLVKTLTFDNGKEFAEHRRIDKALQSTTYFADPFCQLATRIKRKLQWSIASIHPEKEISIYCDQ